MKKFIALTLISAAAIAHAGTTSNDEIISTETVAIANTSISLPKIRKADGKICQSYIAESSHTLIAEEGVIGVKIGQICDEPATVKAGLGSDAIYPKKLKAMHLVKTGDLAIHVVELTN